MVTIEKKSLKVGKFVDTKHVDTVIRTYKQERWMQNSERIGKEDSLSAWYSVEELEEFLAVAKKHGGDGVRIYFAAYPENFAEVPLYAGRQTLVMVGTKSKETENGPLHKDIYIAKGDKTEILAYNMASLCPPLCKPMGSVAFEQIGLAIVDNGDEGLTVI